MSTATTDRRQINRSPYGIARTAAAAAAASALVHPSQARSYFRRVAYRALRRASPTTTAGAAWSIAASAAVESIRILQPAQ
jgi:hypothetical protein